MSRIATFLAGTAFAFAGLVVPNRAEACGGFFCGGVPIDQSGERIIFTLKDGVTEAHVQIQFTGNARSFAWVVPVDARPSLSIGAPAFFTYMDTVTQPRFNLRFDGGSCGFGMFRSGPPMAAAGSEDSANKGVIVVEQEQVGPYDAAILLASDAGSLKTWLKDNGYDLTPQGAEALVPYVGEGYYFVALKLQQDKGVGDLRPIVLRFDRARPCIPIRLTAIAAQPDMPIIAYVFADARAVPQNYRHVLLNETKVDWMSGGSNYRKVASEAIDEAGGHAFLTEFAGPVASAIGQLGPDFMLPTDFDTARLATIAHPVDFLQEMLNQGFPRDAAIQSMLRRYIPLPKSLVGQVSEPQFYNQIAQYRWYIDNDPDRPPFDAVGFAREIETGVVAPLRNAREILAGFPYVTRLFTTMSPDEMTIDPEMHFNRDVPDVSNVHAATGTLFCDALGTDPNTMKVRIDLADGRFFYVSQRTGPITEGPSAERIEQIPESGPPIVLQDNAATINAVINKVGGGMAGAGCACGINGLAPVALFGIAALGRRRRA